MRSVDAVVIGGGIAGVSIGAELTAFGSTVALVEMEATLAFHTTGRSAAMYLRNYGNDTVRRLTIASESYFADADRTHDAELWHPRPFMRVGRAEMVGDLQAEADDARELNPSTQFLTGDDARSLVPALSTDVAAAVLEPDAMELEVAAVHQSYVHRIRAGRGSIDAEAAVSRIGRHGEYWRVDAGDQQFLSPLIVNAAGAWGDRVAAMAGLSPIPLFPLRRTIGIASLPDDIDARGWPLVAFESGDGSMAGYFKPEGNGLLISPADETLDEPSDARPEEIDVALALERVNSWTTLGLRHIAATWAGLRTFTADRTPVAGFASDAAGFFWMVGQGGYGIQMAPGLARAAAALALGLPLPSDLADAGLRPSDLGAERTTLRGPLLGGH